VTASDIVRVLVEDGVDPDDPNVYMRHFQTAWERAGFQPSTTDEGQPRWVWREGIFSVEATRHPEAEAPPAGEGFDALARRANPLAGEWEIYGFINVQDHRQNAYARKVAKTEARALNMAVRLKSEIMNSMAARLTKLGFTGWRNHWHRPPVTVSLKKNYANITVQMDYVPNEQVIPAVTGLSKVSDKILDY